MEGRVGNELRLRAAVLAGDEPSWRVLYDDHSARLRAYTHWRCAGLHDLADEVIQETWLTAVRRMRDFDPLQGSFAAWLFGIAANVLRNCLRSRRLQGRRVLALNGDRPAPADAGHVERERSERITHALAALLPRHEQVLRAKYLDGLSVQTIAGQWGETPKSIESLLTRARQAFREAYQNAEPADG